MRQRRRHALHETTPTACDLFVIETHRIALFIWGWYKFLESMIIFQYGHYIRSNFIDFSILAFCHPVALMDISQFCPQGQYSKMKKQKFFEYFPGAILD